MPAIEGCYLLMRRALNRPWTLDECGMTTAIENPVDGRLTLITMHAAEIAQTEHRTASFAVKAIGENQARLLLASSIRLIMHQRLIPKRTGKGKASLGQLNNGIAVQEAALRAGKEVDLIKAR